MMPCKKMQEEMIITHIPSLVATLQNKERAKGTALTLKRPGLIIGEISTL